MRPPKRRATTQPGPPSPMAAHCTSHGIHREFYDPSGERYGLPTYPLHLAPAGLATRRQLRAMGLRPGRQEIQAQVIWKHQGPTGSKRRVAYLYAVADAERKTPPTPGQLHPGAQALKARRTCPTCGTERDYCISTKLGECNDCAFPQASPAAGDWDPEAARWGWQAGPDEQLQAEAG